MPVSKLLVASILGGIALFIWGGLSHMVLGLGEIGIKELPNEEPVLSALKTNIPESGFYFFPGMGRADGMTKEQQQATRWPNPMRLANALINNQPARNAQIISVINSVINFVGDMASSPPGL